VDVQNTKFAEYRNRANNCKYYKSKWDIRALFDAWRLKSLAVRFLGAATERLSEYSVEQEKLRKAALKQRSRQEAPIVDEERRDNDHVEGNSTEEETYEEQFREALDGEDEPPKEYEFVEAADEQPVEEGDDEIEQEEGADEEEPSRQRNDSELSSVQQAWLSLSDDEREELFERDSS
jgi:hypothetical protein